MKQTENFTHVPPTCCRRPAGRLTRNAAAPESIKSLLAIYALPARCQQHIIFPLLLALFASGCQASAHAPTVDIVGSYFPAWIICIVLGLVLTLIARQIFIALKLDTHLRPIALVYLCLMIAFTLAIWLLIFKN